MADPVLDSNGSDELLSACRTVVGDELRSGAYYTDEGVEQLYLRSDLDRAVDLLGVAELERGRFDAAEAYRDSQLGAYQATVRMFERGYLTRVVSGRRGVWITTDTLCRWSDSRSSRPC